MKKITWYYDFISPYAYLQSVKLADFTDVALLECKPILFAGLLNHWGQLGPAEILPKRQWTFEQVAFLAHRHNIAITMPPMHPFNPIPLLRLAVALELSGQASIANTQRLFKFVWLEGKLPAHTDEVATLAGEFGLSIADIEDPQVKAKLRQNGEQAIAESVFGVPTSVIDGRKFWGFDAGEMLHSYLNDDPFWSSPVLAAAHHLPQGLQRPRA
jgi:2-hydroxychromene-2-carboxylate isomerase